MAKRKQHTSKPTASDHTTLVKHTRLGSKLLPPMAQLPKLNPSSWKDERMPEMLWAALLFTQLPREMVFTKIHKLANFIHQFHETDNPPFNLTLSGINQFQREHQVDFLRILIDSEEYKKALSPLLLFDSLPGREIWNKYLNNQNLDWEPLMIAVANSLDHQSQVSTDCRWVRLVSVIAAGKLMLPSLEMVKEIADYPNRGDQRKVRPTIRATEIALVDLFEINNSVWPSQFWAECLEKTDCFLLTKPNQVTFQPGTTVEKIRSVYSKLLQHCLETRVTTAIDAKHETVFGIAFYSLKLLVELMQINASQTISAQLVLRTMVECFITLAYLSKKDDEKLWKSYRVFGAGQAKLTYLKLETSEDIPNYVDIETLKELANEDLWEEFLPIELGHWDNANLRKLSEEAGVKEIYDRYYSWTSSYLHGHWGPIRDTIYDTCGNPLHRLHRIPGNQQQLLPDVLPDACMIIDRILETVSNCYPSFAVRVNLEEHSIDTLGEGNE
jgi:hypothetical protein